MLSIVASRDFGRDCFCGPASEIPVGQVDKNKGTYRGGLFLRTPNTAYCKAHQQKRNLPFSIHVTRLLPALPDLPTTTCQHCHTSRLRLYCIAGHAPSTTTSKPPHQILPPFRHTPPAADAGRSPPAPARRRSRRPYIPDAVLGPPRHDHPSEKMTIFGSRQPLRPEPELGPGPADDTKRKTPNARLKTQD